MIQYDFNIQFCWLTHSWTIFFFHLSFVWIVFKTDIPSISDDDENRIIIIEETTNEWNNRHRIYVYCLFIFDYILYSILVYVGNMLIFSTINRNIESNRLVTIIIRTTSTTEKLNLIPSLIFQIHKQIVKRFNYFCDCPFIQRWKFIYFNCFTLSKHFCSVKNQFCEFTGWWTTIIGWLMTANVDTPIPSPFDDLHQNITYLLILNEHQSMAFSFSITFTFRMQKRSERFKINHNSLIVYHSKVQANWKWRKIT